VVAHEIIRGLTEADAEARLKMEGPNELSRSFSKSCGSRCWSCYSLADWSISLWAT